MEDRSYKIKHFIFCRKEDEFIDLLRSGLDPNLEGGWPIRLAARYGCSAIVNSLIQFGANPHLLSKSGASTLQLAVYSGEHWNTDNWALLISCCDSSQLADGAAVAVIFNNDAALRKILSTGRCNTNIPTTLTGKTLEILAKGYKLTHLPISPIIQHHHQSRSTISPLTSRQNITLSDSELMLISLQTYQINQARGYYGDRESDGFIIEVRREDSTSAVLSPYRAQRNLSPSVARFFCQTAGQTSLSPTRGEIRPTFSVLRHNN